jgi:hypothetical protein
MSNILAERRFPSPWSVEDIDTTFAQTGNK